MKFIWWLIRYTTWFVALLFIMTSIVKLINLKQIELEYGCGCGQSMNGGELSGIVTLISSFIFALYISFTHNLWKAIKKVIWFFLIPVGILYFIYFINWIIGLTGIINLPLINTNSEGFIKFYCILFIIYSVFYGVISLPEDNDEYY